jgi:succinoglycan biosynthesis protein ExoM
MAMASVDICICTFRRDSVAETIASVQRQAIPPGVSARILVVDNDDTPSAGHLVQAEADVGQVEIVYLHAPGRNISIARNAVLSASAARYAAFLDDDETAEAGWLSALWARHRETGADVVLGPVDPVYPDSAPDWMRASAIHATRPVYVRGTIRTGYTCNVLIDRLRPEIRDLRFDPDLGRSGGEDSDFFARIGLMGGRIDYAPEALVTEPVARERLSFSWLAQRRYRMGMTHAGVLMRRHGMAPWRVLPLAAAKMLACFCLALACAALKGGRAAAMLRGALHAGVVAGLMGRRTPVLYGGQSGRRVDP